MADAASLHREMFEVAFARDFEGLRRFYHPDYVYMDGSGVEQPGADAGVAVAETYMTAFPDVTFELRHQYAPSDDVSIIEFTARGTHQAPLDDIPATGKHVTINVCNVIEVRDGKIHREREYYDTLAILQQLGVMGGD